MYVYIHQTSDITRRTSSNQNYSLKYDFFKQIFEMYQYFLYFNNTFDRLEIFEIYQDFLNICL